MLVGVLGCMAERLKGKLLEEEKLVTWWLVPMLTAPSRSYKRSRKRPKRRKCFTEPRRNLWRYFTYSAEQQWGYLFC